MAKIQQFLARSTYTSQSIPDPQTTTNIIMCCNIFWGFSVNFLGIFCMFLVGVFCLHHLKIFTEIIWVMPRKLQLYGHHNLYLLLPVLCLGQDLWGHRCPSTWISGGHLQILGDTPSLSKFYLLNWIVIPKFLFIFYLNLSLMTISFG